MKKKTFITFLACFQFFALCSNVKIRRALRHLRRRRKSYSFQQNWRNSGTRHVISYTSSIADHESIGRKVIKFVVEERKRNTHLQYRVVSSVVEQTDTFEEEKFALVCPFSLRSRHFVILPRDRFYVSSNNFNQEFISFAYSIADERRLSIFVYLQFFARLRYLGSYFIMLNRRIEYLSQEV